MPLTAPFTRLSLQRPNPIILDRCVLGIQRKVSCQPRRLAVPVHQCCHRNRFDNIRLELAHRLATSDLGDLGDRWVTRNGLLVGGRVQEV